MRKRPAIPLVGRALSWAGVLCLFVCTAGMAIVWGSTAGSVRGFDTLAFLSFASGFFGSMTMIALGTIVKNTALSAHFAEETAATAERIGLSCREELRRTRELFEHPPSQ